MTREQKILETRRLRRLGLTAYEIGRRLGISDSTVRNWWNGGECEVCGAPIDGSKSRKSVRCNPCANPQTAPHGSTARYQGTAYRPGCRCQLCRAANLRYHNSLKTGIPPNHGYSGYLNYGCRCEVCSAARREHDRQHPEYQQRWRDKVRGTEPPRHGYSVAYTAYGCRCDECRAWAARNWQKRRRRRMEVAA